MLLFNAGAIYCSNQRRFDAFEQILLSAGGRINRLISYAEIKDKQSNFNFWIRVARDRKRIFLDSGAFSAFTTGRKIDIDQYIGFIQHFQPHLYCYAALDVIGDWRRTQVNYDHMRAVGLSPIATFHHGSPWTVLAAYCEMRIPYLALGGLVPIARNKPAMRQHLDRCWSILRQYWPIKVHAFGITAPWVLERYPFFSCDSTAAMMGGGMGRINSFSGGRLTVQNWREAGQRGEYPLMVDFPGRKRASHINRRTHNARVMQQLEAHVTQLWASRGITWD